MKRSITIITLDECDIEGDMDLVGTFSWYRHKSGYQIVDRPFEESGTRKSLVVIEAKDPDSIIGYTLETRDQGMFKTFAEMDATEENFVWYANKYGLLTPSGRGGWEDLSYWINENETAAALRDLVKLPFKSDYEKIISFFNQSVRPVYRAHIESSPKGPRASFLKLSPVDLMGVMWMQYFDMWRLDIELRPCSECLTWFPVGRGTRTKSDSKKSCSSNCRQALSRRLKKELKS